PRAGQANQFQFAAPRKEFHKNLPIDPRTVCDKHARWLAHWAGLSCFVEGQYGPLPPRTSAPCYPAGAAAAPFVFRLSLSEKNRILRRTACNGPRPRTVGSYVYG